MKVWLHVKEAVAGLGLSKDLEIIDVTMSTMHQGYLQKIFEMSEILDEVN